MLDCRSFYATLPLNRTFVFVSADNVAVSVDQFYTIRESIMASIEMDSSGADDK